MIWRTTAEPMKPAPPVTSIRLDIGVPNELEWSHEILEGPELAILVRQHHRVGGDRPRDIQRRIVPDEAAVGRRRIEGVDLVGDLGVRFGRAETVCKSARHEQLFAPLRAELD